MSDDDTLVRRRSKRSTAGNRMAAALAEFANEQLPADIDDDNDFRAPDDEDEVFDSDFASTEEEDVQEDVEEKAVQEEEKREHRVTRQRLAKTIEAATQRNKASFETHPESKPTHERVRRTRRRVMLGNAVDAVTGEVVGSPQKRKSRRKSTVLNTQQMHSRLKDAEIKRAAMPRKVREVTRILSQAELIQQALDTEEGNIKEHRDYLIQEEEKRRRARVVRMAVTGPLVRWVSKVEFERPRVEEVQTMGVPSGSQVTPGITTTQSSSLNVPGPSSISLTPSAVQATTPISQPAVVRTDTFVVPPPPSYTVSRTFPFLPSTTQPFNVPTASSNPGNTTTTSNRQQQQQPTQAQGSTSTTDTPLTSVSPPQPQPQSSPEPQPVTKCYAVHELGQYEGTPKPKWEDTMSALFGDHVKWSDVKVYSSKNRPLSRPVQKCAITGRPAPYRDPRTMVPFANVESYKTLTEILQHKLVWNAELGCYTMNETDFE